MLGKLFAQVSQWHMNQRKPMIDIIIMRVNNESSSHSMCSKQCTQQYVSLHKHVSNICLVKYLAKFIFKLSNSARNQMLQLSNSARNQMYSTCTNSMFIIQFCSTSAKFDHINSSNHQRGVVPCEGVVPCAGVVPCEGVVPSTALYHQSSSVQITATRQTQSAMTTASHGFFYCAASHLRHAQCGLYLPCPFANYNPVATWFVYFHGH